MRRDYRRFASLSLHAGLLVVLIGVSAAVPATALGSSNGFCATLSGRTSDADRQLTTAQSQLTRSWQTQDSNFSIIRRQQSADLSNLRQDVQTLRAENLLSLDEHYDVRDQQVSINTYRSAVRMASKHRVRAVNAARGQYEAAMQRTISDRRATLSGQVQALKIAVDDAFNEAEADCAAAISPAVVETQLQTRLAVAHKTFVSQRHNDDAIVSVLQQLALQRNQRIAVADEDYEHTTAMALQTLRSRLTH